MSKAACEPILEKGLPCNVDTERFVLGSILLDDSLYLAAAAILETYDFALRKHRLIWDRMTELHERGERIDRVTLANELLKHGQLESCDGLTYLVSLDDSLPRTSNIEAYARIVRDCAYRRRIVFQSQKLIDRAVAGEESAGEILGDAAERFLTLSNAQTTAGDLLSLGDVVERAPGGINAFLYPSKRAKGIATGFVKFDEMTGGLHPGELIILAARPSMGKTSLAMNIAVHVAQVTAKQPVGVFSLEMSDESLYTRLICAEARVDQQKFRAGYLNCDERRRLVIAANQLRQAPLFIDDTAEQSLTDIYGKLRRMKSEKGLCLAVVDYLQLMATAGGRRQENRAQEIGAISRGLKLMSKDLKIPVIAVAQLNRAPEQRLGDHRPMLQDLRESGSQEQDADVVAFIFRAEVYKPDREDLRGQAELIVAKHRNGPTGKIQLVFLRQWTKFENRAADLGEEPEQGVLTGMESEGGG